MRYGMRTTLSWIPGHANIAGNEIADQLAKEAAKESGVNKSCSPMPGASNFHMVTVRPKKKYVCLWSHIKKI
jgi:hypothetical protein